MSDFSSFDIQAHVIPATRDTFETMLSMEVTPLEGEASELAGQTRMVGSLNFAGNVIGIVNIQITSNFGHQMAAGMLGVPPEEVGSIEEVKELLAEIANIVGGKLKSALSDAGFPCVISTPAITCGADFTIKSLNMERFERFVFACGDETIVVEIGLKQQEVVRDPAEFDATDITARLESVDVAKIDALDCKAKIAEAVTEVFGTMLAMELEVSESIAAADLEGMRNAASVCFAGDATGIVNIQVSDEFSRIMAAGMLGMDPGEIEGQEGILDLLGELANIVGGSLKSALNDAGLACALSPPCFTTGTDFQIEPLNLERYERMAFAHGGHTVFVEMGLKISDPAETADPNAKEKRSEDVADDSESAALEDAPWPSAAEDVPGPSAEEPATAAAADAPEPESPCSTVEPSGSAPAEDFDLEMLMDIPLEITVELGRTRIRIRELLDIAPGSAVKLSRLEGEPVDILANDTLIARGEVVVQNEKYGIRITEITSRMDRIRNLR